MQTQTGTPIRLDGLVLRAARSALKTFPAPVSFVTPQA
jgi:hypothetical protein